jgi:hypothetical protein
LCILAQMHEVVVKENLRVLVMWSFLLGKLSRADS